MLIKELNMSKRTTDILLANGVDTVEKLTSFTHNKVIKLRNMGRMSFLEVLEKMKELNLKFEEASEDEY